MSNSNAAWTTAHELAFIRHLATQDAAPCLLDGYLAGLRRRVDFGEIDSAVVVTAARDALTDCMASLGVAPIDLRVRLSSARVPAHGGM